MVNGNDEGDDDGWLGATFRTGKLVDEHKQIFVLCIGNCPFHLLSPIMRRLFPCNLYPSAMQPPRAVNEAWLDRMAPSY